MGIRAVPRKRRKFIYDVETKNISFIQTASDLKTLGIKNNMFFLKLYNEDLRGVDPHSPMLTDQQRSDIILECIINPWYFLRECVRIPDQGGNGIPYQLNRANLALTFCFLNGIVLYLVIPRQIGKTQSTLAILLWTFLFGTTNSEFMFINKKQEDADNNLGRLKVQRELLPPFMRMKEIMDGDGKKLTGKNNVKSIFNPANGNSIVTKPSASSVEKAEGIGRGCSQTVQYFDETEFTSYIKTIIEASGPAYRTAAANARRNNAAYGRILTSTPGDLDTQPGKDSEKIINDTCKWTEKFYDWTTEQIEDYVKKNSGNGIVYIEYAYQQLGKDEEWLQEMCASLLNNPMKIKREVFLQRMHGSSESPFEIEDLNMVQELKRKVKEEIFINNVFRLDIYTPLDRDKIYIMGMDCAQGLGGDSTAVTVLDPYNLEPCAEFKSPYMSIPDAVKFVVTLIRKFIPRSIAAIERNNVGTAIIDGLMKTSVRPNIYFEDTPEGLDIDDKLDGKGFLKVEAARRKMRGVWTGTKSRDLMMKLLEGHMQNYKDKFVTENIIGNIMTLVRKKSGKIEHSDGNHDDSLFSYLIALYVFYYGKNLQRFGFVPGQLPGEKERNRGLSYEEVVQELPEEVKSQFSESGTKSMDDYSKKIREEIEQARREMQGVDFSLGAQTTIENLDEDNSGADGSISLDFFDDLNDI